jgi:1-acyl-sn-glycerol-3-phosphate acyltransferase
VVPVTIDESWRLLGHNLLPAPFGVRIRVRFGEPIARSPGEDRMALVERARKEIEATLLRWRGE